MDSDARLIKIQNMIEERMEKEQRFIELCEEYEKLLDEEKRYDYLINDAMSVMYGLELAYDMVCEVMAED